MKRVQDTLYDIIDTHTGENFNYSKVTIFSDGTAMDDSKADGIIYRKLNGEYFKRNFTGAVNVKWFGAKGDGITDDSLAIQKAINYVNSVNKGSIFFENGLYNHTGIISRGSNISFIGDVDSVLDFVGVSINSVGVHFLPKVGNLFFENIKLEKITLKHAFVPIRIGESYPANSSCKNVIIDNCSFIYGYSCLVDIYKSDNVLITNSTFKYGGDNGAFINFSKNVIISNNNFFNVQGSGAITVGYEDDDFKSENILISNNVITCDAGETVVQPQGVLPFWILAGVCAIFCRNVKIDNNIISNIVPNNIATYNNDKVINVGVILNEYTVNDVTISNNQILKMRRESFRFGEESTTSIISNINLINNISLYPGEKHCWIQRTTNFNFIGNTFRGSDEEAVFVENNCQTYSFIRNIFEDVTTRNFYNNFSVFKIKGGDYLIKDNIIRSGIKSTFIKYTGVGVPKIRINNVPGVSIITLFVNDVIVSTIDMTSKTFNEVALLLNAIVDFEISTIPKFLDFKSFLIRRTGSSLDADVSIIPFTVDNLAYLGVREPYNFYDKPVLGTGIIEGNTFASKIPLNYPFYSAINNA